MKLEVLKQATSSKLSKQLLNKESPNCPQCTGETELLSKGVQDQTYECKEKYHTFDVATEKVLSNKQLSQLLLKRVKNIDTLMTLHGILEDHFNLEIEFAVDPYGGIYHRANGRDIRIKHWLEINELENKQLENTLRENSKLVYREDSDNTKIFNKPPEPENNQLQQDDKADFTRTASNNNGSIQVNVPPEIAKHLNLEPGDTIGLQTEYSKDYGPYASFWNQTKQEEQ